MTRMENLFGYETELCDIFILKQIDMRTCLNFENEVNGVDMFQKKTGNAISFILGQISHFLITFFGDFSILHFVSTFII